MQNINSIEKIKSSISQLHLSNQVLNTYLLNKHVNRHQKPTNPKPQTQAPVQ